MKRIFFISLLLLAAGVGVFGQKPETRPLKPFSKISIQDRIIAYLQSGDLPQVFIDPKGDAWNEEIKTIVSGSILDIKSDGKFRDAQIYCFVQYSGEITELIARYGGKFITDSGVVFAGKKLLLDAKIDGFANMDVSVDELEITAGSGSDVYIRGKAKKVIIHATSGAKIHLDDLDCDDAEVHCAMGAKVWLTAKTSYKATAGTGGKIYYYSEPTGNFERNRITGGNVELITR
jgi:hypothetical protein